MRIKNKIGKTIRKTLGNLNRTRRKFTNYLRPMFERGYDDDDVLRWREIHDREGGRESWSRYRNRMAQQSRAAYLTALRIERDEGRAAEILQRHRLPVQPDWIFNGHDTPPAIIDEIVQQDDFLDDWPGDLPDELLAELPAEMPPFLPNDYITFIHNRIDVAVREGLITPSNRAPALAAFVVGLPRLPEFDEYLRRFHHGDDMDDENIPRDLGDVNAILRRHAVRNGQVFDENAITMEDYLSVLRQMWGIDDATYDSDGAGRKKKSHRKKSRKKKSRKKRSHKKKSRKKKSHRRT